MLWSHILLRLPAIQDSARAFEEVIFANWPIPCRLLVDYVDEWFSLYFIIYRCVVGLQPQVVRPVVPCFE